MRTLWRQRAGGSRGTYHCTRSACSRSSNAAVLPHLLLIIRRHPLSVASASPTQALPEARQHGPQPSHAPDGAAAYQSGGRARASVRNHVHGTTAVHAWQPRLQCAGKCHQWETAWDGSARVDAGMPSRSHLHGPAGHNIRNFKVNLEATNWLHRSGLPVHSGLPQHTWLAVHPSTELFGRHG